MDDYAVLWQLLILGVTVYSAYKIGEAEGMVRGYKEGIEESESERASNSSDF